MSDLHAIHGGDFFQAIGLDFRHIDAASDIVSADVLDAWYKPSPTILDALRANFDWLVATSPPDHSEGLIAEIATARGLDPTTIVAGTGTYGLMFSVLPKLVDERGIAVLDPMYGEYAQIGENVIGCEVRRFELPLDTCKVDVARLAAFATGSSVLAIVNPNSPTGVAMKRSEIESLLAAMPSDVTLWIDETYIDFLSNWTGGNESAEQLVARYPNLVVSKSMSKFYALSRLRVGYLVASPDKIADWQRHNPPWSVGTMGQLAAILALRDKAYYDGKASETHALREALAGEIEGRVPCRIVPSMVNFLLVRLAQPRAAELVAHCAAQNVFIRDCGSVSSRFINDTVRIAVKTESQNLKTLDAMSSFF